MQVASSYEKARIYIQEHSSENERAIHRRNNPGPIITISRETGIGAAAICERLTDYFNSHAIEDYNDWTFFDKGLIEKVMEDHHLPDHFKKHLSEEKVPRFETWFGEVIGITPSSQLLLRKTSQTILQLAEFGNVIIVGRGANIVTANFKRAFHIRLVAPLNYRIENSMKLYNLDHKTASNFIKEEDEARKDYLKKYFHKNVNDPLLYHAVINTNLLSYSEIAEMIGHCVLKRFPNFFNLSKLQLQSIS